MDKKSKIELIKFLFYYETVEGIDSDNLERWFEVLKEFEKVDFNKWLDENNLHFGKWLNEKDLWLEYQINDKE